MLRSPTRILTTHTGSLPRPAALLDLMLFAEQAGRLADRQALAEETRRAVAEVVRQQSAAGLDVINDGELNRVDYTVYVKDRLTGFEGESAPPLGTGDEEFPSWRPSSGSSPRPSSTGRPVAARWHGRTGPPWRPTSGSSRTRRRAWAPRSSSCTAPSPGQIARFLRNRYYPDDIAYLRALGSVMKAQYEARSFTRASSCSSTVPISR